MTEEKITPTAEEIAAKAEADKKAAEEAKKTPKDYILERTQKREAKLKEELEQLRQEKEFLKPSEGDMDSKIQEIVAKKLEANAKVSEFIHKYPSLAEDRAQIEKYVHDPSRQGVPVETRILEAVGVDKFIKLGATTNQKAEQDALETKMGGEAPMTDTEKAEYTKKREKYDDMFKKSLQGHKRVFTK